MSGTGVPEQAGAACFGVAVGYLTYRALVSVLAAAVGAAGGAAVIGLFAASVFAWSSIGLLAGMAVFFALFGRLNGLQRLAAVLSVRAEAPGPGRHVSEQEPDRAAGQPTVVEVS